MPEETASRRGGARYLLIGQVFRGGLQLLAILILSRLLTPEEFGASAVVLAIVSVAGILGDLGLSVAAIREKDLSRDQWSGLFWVNFGLGTVLSIGFAAAAPYLTSAVGGADLRGYFLLIAPVFALNGFAVQYRVELVRQARYAHLVAVESVAPAAGLVVAIVLAVRGVGAGALVAQPLAAAVVLAVSGLLVVRRLPGRPRRGAGLARILSLGGVASATSVLHSLTANMATITLGRAVPQELVGAYSRTSQISQMAHVVVGVPMTRVVVPAFAGAMRTGTFLERFRGALVGYGFSVGLGAALTGGLANAVVAIVLGDQWTDIAPTILSILVAGNLLQVIGYVGYWALIAAGATRRLLLCDLPGQVIALVGVFLVSRHGPEMVALAITVGTAVRVASSVFWGMPAVGIGVRQLVRVSLPTFGICLTVFGGALVLDNVLSERSPWLVVGVGVLWTLLVLTIARSVSRTVRADLADAMRLFAGILRGRADGGAAAGQAVVHAHVGGR